MRHIGCANVEIEKIDFSIFRFFSMVICSHICNKKSPQFFLNLVDTRPRYCRFTEGRFSTKGGKSSIFRDFHYIEPQVADTFRAVGRPLRLWSKKYYGFWTSYGYRKKMPYQVFWPKTKRQRNGGKFKLLFTILGTNKVVASTETNLIHFNPFLSILIYWKTLWYTEIRSFYPLGTLQMDFNSVILNLRLGYALGPMCDVHCTFDLGNNKNII